VETARGRPVRIAVLNDYPMVVAGVTAMLAPYRDRVLVAERGTHIDVKGHPDLVLYDTFGAAKDPADMVRSILQRNHAPLVVYSWAANAALVRRSLDAGAVAFVPKSLGPSQLVAELERIHRQASEAFRPPVVRPGVQAGDWPGSEHGLSVRESEIVALIARGLSNQEIAALTFLSINSVKTYIRTAYRRMGVKTRSQAVLWAIQHGFEPTLAADPAE
jgi:two-component system, NarL family, response regulator LiaR